MKNASGMTGGRLAAAIVLIVLAAACGKAAPSPAATRGAAPPPVAAPAPAAAPHDASTMPAMAAAGPPQTLAEWAKGAQAFTGLGAFHRTITTSSSEAQEYFDQGMRLMWAFNHDEATRSFARAAQLDPACAMCYWAVALTVGPNYNLPIMVEARAKVAWDALQKAQQLAPRSRPVEQALIAALAQRYKGPQPLDPSNSAPVFAAYASAMRDVAAKYQDDLDVQVLFAESMMDMNAWKLWTIDGQPAPGTEEIERTLERVLSINPAHPGANHYYVHTMEASPHPERAVAAAERLKGMMPAAGHLQHMPAHIMQRVGRYEDASEANREGIAADMAYMTMTSPPDYYAMYFAHNYQFLAYSAAMEGRRAEAVDAARKMRAMTPIDMLLMMPGADWYLSEAYSVLLRFGLWDDMLAEPAPDARLPNLTAAYDYGRAVAFAEKGRVADAKAALAALEQIAAKTPADAAAGYNSAREIDAVAILVARGHIAAAQRDLDGAIAAYRSAVAKEDRLAYDEPADWFQPVRHQLGAALLAAHKAADAEAVYREDLTRNPDNGWALFGLAQALAAQGKADEALQAQAQFKNAWAHADATLHASVY